MRKFTIIAVSAMTIAMIAGCSNGSEREAMQDSLADMNQQYQQASSFNDSLLLLMSDIYTGLDSINSQEGLLYNLGPGENSERREAIRENLSNIRARLEANRELLDKLENDLKNSKSQNAVLAKTISQLKARIDEQNKKINDLENQLASTKQELAQANTQIDNLNTTVAQKEEQVRNEAAAKEEAQAAQAAAEKEANTVYYAVGTNKELKNNGILSKKFLGSTKIMKGDYNLQYFRQADRRTLTQIQLGGKFDKIWTNAPAGSYEIIDNGDKSSTFRITDPARFWSITNHLIIQIK